MSRRILRSWTVNVVEDEPFTMLTVKDGKSVDTGRRAVTVLRTKGDRNVTHAADIPEGWDTRYHLYCRVALGRRAKSDPLGAGYVILRCL